MSYNKQIRYWSARSYDFAMLNRAVVNFRHALVRHGHQAITNQPRHIVADVLPNIIKQTDASA